MEGRGALHMCINLLSKNDSSDVEVKGKSNTSRIYVACVPHEQSWIQKNEAEPSDFHWASSWYYLLTIPEDKVLFDSLKSW